MLIEQRCQTIFPLRLQTGMGERHKATSAGISDLKGFGAPRHKHQENARLATLARHRPASTATPHAPDPELRMPKFNFYHAPNCARPVATRKRRTQGLRLQ